MDERQALEDAFMVIYNLSELAPDDWSALNWPIADRFTAMLDCGAYLSAAMMLLGHPGNLDELGRSGSEGRFYARIWSEPHKQLFDAVADTPSAALLSAILAARSTKP